MKPAGAQIAALLRDPGNCRVILLFGDDAGMIRERAEALVRAVAGSLDDPFRVVDLARDEFENLPDEAASMSLTGGRRVVRYEHGCAAIEIQQYEFRTQSATAAGTLAAPQPSIS